MGMNLKCGRKFLTPQGMKILVYEIFSTYTACLKEGFGAVRDIGSSFEVLYCLLVWKQIVSS